MLGVDGRASALKGRVGDLVKRVSRSLEGSIASGAQGRAGGVKVSAAGVRERTQ